MRVQFDDSLPYFAALVQREWGSEAIVENLFLRDVTGRLTLVVLNPNRSAGDVSSLAKKAADELKPYVDDAGFAVATPSELFEDSLSLESNVRKIQIQDDAFKGTVNIIDRRMIGADWLRTPAHARIGAPAKIVFASLKGGVGRSTALCVTAAHLAGKGKRVLTIDMDLEAPGLGNMLLPGDTLPRYGLLDYLVEQSFGELDAEFYADLVGSSWLGQARGRVDVLPAIGGRSLKHPVNVLAKIARAYLSGPEVNGIAQTFSDHMSALVDRFSDPLRYDVILIDARAGLHETTAAALVGLGAEVLLFGIDQPQTYAAYELLLAHLGTLPIDPNDDWRERLQFVQAKAMKSGVAGEERFENSIRTLAAQYLWPSSGIVEVPDLAPLSDIFTVEWSEDMNSNAAANSRDDLELPIVDILSDSRYAFFDPISEKGVLEEQQYLPAFGRLLDVAADIVDAAINNKYLEI